MCTQLGLARASTRGQTPIQPPSLWKGPHHLLPTDPAGGACPAVGPARRGQPPPPGPGHRTGAFTLACSLQHSTHRAARPEKVPRGPDPGRRGWVGVPPPGHSASPCSTTAVGPGGPACRELTASLGWGCDKCRRTCDRSTWGPGAWRRPDQVGQVALGRRQPTETRGRPQPRGRSG